VNTERLAQAGDKLDDFWRQVAARFHSLAEPSRQRQIKLGLYAAACVWMVFALASLVWSLMPRPEAAAQPELILNPLVEPADQGSRRAVNIEELVAWDLFGTATTAPPELVEESGDGATEELAGIEENARETRLDLKLQGIVSSSDPAEARAIIESRNKQEQYAVGDELPVGSRVKVAKILDDRVVIDNQGTYELLLLFDLNDLQAMRSEPAAQPSAVPQEEPETVDQRGDQDITQLAESYRQRLYSNPRALAQVVNIAAVREQGQLMGYRVSPGNDQQQFEALGFKSNDIVTGVNGIQLSDPGKAIELYRVMRNATEASFEVLRDGEQLTLVVGLQSPDSAGQ
jgi:general secretion pathway protein C